MVKKFCIIYRGPVSYSEEEISNGACLQAYTDNNDVTDVSGSTIRSILKEVNGESYSFEYVYFLILYQNNSIGKKINEKNVCKFIYVWALEIILQTLWMN